MTDTFTAALANDRNRTALADAWNIPLLHYDDVVDSTQNVARRLADEGAATWTVVAANHQTAGRGQHGRTWLADAGMSLTFSIVMRPATADAAALLPVRIGMATATALDGMLRGAAMMLKWPNDLVLRDGKAGGILCEAQSRGDEHTVLVGIGVNVRRFAVRLAEARDLAPAFLDSCLAPGITRLDVFDAVIAALRNARWDAPLLSADELAAYADRDWLAGNALAAPIEGIARGIDEHGRLVVAMNDGSLQTAVTGRVEIK